MRQVLSGVSLAIMLTGQALAAPGSIRTVEKVVAPGQTLRVFSASVVDQGCRSLGPMRIGLLEEPNNGQVEVGSGRDYPSFPTWNTRSRCNTQKVPATVVTYRPAAGYTGEDSFAMEFVGPLGNVGRIRYAISVR